VDPVPFFVCQRAAAATEELASALAKYKNTSKQIHNIVNGAFLNKGLSLSQCYRIVETVKKRQKFGGNERSEKQEPNQNLEDSGGQSSWPQTISEPCSILPTV
jgi:hypothetical protein